MGAQQLRTLMSQQFVRVGVMILDNPGTTQLHDQIMVHTEGESSGMNIGLSGKLWCMMRQVYYL